MPYPAYVPSCGLPPQDRQAQRRRAVRLHTCGQGGDNHGWKLTLSQNIAIGMGPEFRPMLRFYVTGGQVDNEHTAKVNNTKDQQLDSLNVGGMFEAWF